jgi:lipopolysaccharide export system permease protein
MNSIDRYIFRATLGAFTLVLVTLTSAIWMTQALRDLDLITSQGQSILTFVGITSLVIPSLMLVLAPVSLVIAIIYVLNKLTNDSEIIVMNSAGMAPSRLVRPYIASALVVSILVGLISAYLSPKCLRELRRMATEIRVDVVANIVQAGRFTTIENNLVFYLRERQPDGILLGIFINDRRNPLEEISVLAEQGEVIESPQGSYILLGNGSLQRHEAGQRDPAIVHFDRYAFDLSQFTGRTGSPNLAPRELFLWELFSPPEQYLEAGHAKPGQFRAELHERLVAPFYPLAFTVIVFALLGAPRTTRQRNAAALGMAIGAVAALRIAGFASTVLSVRTPAAVALQYIAVAVTFGFGIRAILRGTIIEPPAAIMDPLMRVIDRVVQRIAERFPIFRDEDRDARA